MVGHDIRQPLCAIQVGSEILMDHIREGRTLEAVDILHEIRSSTEFMNYLIDGLLDSHKKPSSKNFIGDRTWVDPIPIINRNYSSNKKIASRKGIDLILEIDPSLTISLSSNKVFN